MDAKKQDAVTEMTAADWHMMRMKGYRGPVAVPGQIWEQDVPGEIGKTEMLKVVTVDEEHMASPTVLHFLGAGAGIRASKHPMESGLRLIEDVAPLPTEKVYVSSGGNPDNFTGEVLTYAQVELKHRVARCLDGKLWLPVVEPRPGHLMDLFRYDVPQAVCDECSQRGLPRMDGEHPCPSCGRPTEFGASDLESAEADAARSQGRAVRFTYQNYKGITDTRHVLPISIAFMKSQWHPGPCWILRAFDYDRKAIREFAMDFITDWEEGTKGAGDEEPATSDTFTGKTTHEVFREVRKEASSRLKDALALGALSLGLGFLMIVEAVEGRK